MESEPPLMKLRRGGRLKTAETVRILYRDGGTGGVVGSAERLKQFLEVRGHSVETCNLAALTSYVKLGIQIRPRQLNILWCSSPSAIGHHSAVARITSGEKWLFLHAASEAQIDSFVAKSPSNHRQLRVFDRIFCNNSSLADCINQTGTAAVIRSCFSPLSYTIPPTSQRSHDIVIACGGAASSSIYRVAHAVDALQKAYSGDGMSSGRKLHLILYGPGSQEPYHGPDFVHVHRDLDQVGCAKLISKSTLFLRPTSKDGDSILVRDALDAGVRVIASDVCPRPAGVEVYSGGSDALAAAILDGGNLSSGEGLGGPIGEEIVRRFA